MRYRKLINWKYAIGEVVLIFLGISLAISFNNWNDLRKRRQLEKEILELILLDLEREEETMRFTHRIDSLRVQDLNVILQWTKDKSIPFDSVKHLLNRVVRDESYDGAPTVGYATLRDNGAQLVRNDSLRQQILLHYTEWVPATNEYVRRSTDMVLSNYDYFLHHFKSFNFWGDGEIVPLDEAALRSDPEFHQRVRLAIFARERQMLLCSDLVEHQVSPLQKAIRRELEAE